VLSCYQLALARSMSQPTFPPGVSPQSGLPVPEEWLVGSAVPTTPDPPMSTYDVRDMRYPGNYHAVRADSTALASR
jgi:hypothetical protein